MTTYVVSCVNKPDPFNPFSRILGLGGPGWYMSENEIIDRIENRGDSFVVYALGFPPANVYVSRGPTGIPDLKTMADGLLGNNLLFLSQCAL